MFEVSLKGSGSKLRLHDNIIWIELARIPFESINRNIFYGRHYPSLLASIFAPNICRTTDFIVDLLGPSRVSGCDLLGDPTALVLSKHSAICASRPVRGQSELRTI